ncbi:MAG: hypothetical protein A3C02_00960 [Candidatus Andersenbacteria bacterium RIFCSPHIGHO2_02_FULL_45_11]|nr:MAG: hypothetical protein A3C02_00960 [Candidatus Andersenbacteria bacterium RIFCSPHIGHO2_02_FULL_45_11]
MLMERGANVYVLDNFSYGAKKSNIHTGTHIFEGDVSIFQSFLELPKIEYAYLFHFAGPSSIVLFQQTPEKCIRETVSGFLNATDFCSQRSIKLIFPSSGSVYSGTTLPQQEHSRLNIDAMNTYARSKYALEHLQAAYGTTLRSTALRIFAGYGTSEDHKGDTASVVYSFCKKIGNNERPVIYGNGNQKRDFIYIEDLVNAILTLAEHCDEPVVNIGSGTSISLTELVSVINKISGTALEPIYAEKPTGYLEKTHADISILKRYYTEPMTPITQGIEQVMKFLYR